MNPPAWPKQIEDVLSPVPGSSRLMRLREDFPIVYEYQGELYRFWLDHGWVYDVASIPRIFWLFVSWPELGYEATAAHDDAIEKRGLLFIEKWDREQQKWTAIGYVQFTRKEVDKFFAMKMREKGINIYKRRLAYRFVRLWSKLKGDDWDE